MQHHAATDFWHEYLALPREIRARADQRFSLPKADPRLDGFLRIRDEG
jgi:hypothetical protein